jgi:lipoyl(octanoyl) transferase
MEWKISSSLVDYNEAINYMEQRVASIIAGQASELVWMLEHPPLYTAGVSAKEEELLAADHFPVISTGRGGKYTYHGPGQRVIYAMLDLKKRAEGKSPDLKKYIRDLEEWLLRSFKEIGIEAKIHPDRIGVWVQDGHKEAKIAAIGIRVRKWVTYHGIAININPNLNHFASIIPCGIKEYGVTSLEKLGKAISMTEVDLILQEKFKEIF